MTARVNITTGKIIGAEKDSFAWWHEKGHIAYDNSALGITNAYTQQMWLFVAVTMAIISIQVKLLWSFAAISIIGFWYYFFYEERWCNNYAKLKLQKGGKKHV